MRNAIVQLPAQRTVSEQRQALRTAIRQLERADIYLAAVAHVDLDDRAALGLLNEIRTELSALRRHLSEQRVGTRR
jgi:hypothetical protein